MDSETGKMLTALQQRKRKLDKEKEEASKITDLDREQAAGSRDFRGDSPWDFRVENRDFRGAVAGSCGDYCGEVPGHQEKSAEEGKEEEWQHL